MALNLLSTTSRVEVPFINVEIGGYSFGIYDKQTKSVTDNEGYSKKIIASYPNYIKSLSINKINGAVNTYNVSMDYAIRGGDDPNFLEKVFSKASSDRRITLSYGDLASPTFIFKKETAIMSDVRSSFSFEGSKISYNISCTSDAISLTAGTYFFPRRNEKPSKVLTEILYDNRYGLLDVFYGMRDRELVEARGLIATDDKKVVIEAQSNISVLDYMSYLISCMTSLTSTDNKSLLSGNKYIISVFDSTTGEFGGPYFKVQKVARSISDINSLDTYTIDIGYPSPNNVISFTIDNNQQYSILYDYSQKIEQSEYNYRINDNGVLEYIYSPLISRQSMFYKTTEADKTWWTRVTQYPITAKLTIKGLLRPALLMTYLKINTIFYGRKHISSGTYIITAQNDTIDESGYKTTLSLTRIAGEEV